MMENTVENLKQAIELMCKRFDMETKYFHVIGAKEDRVFRGHTIYIKGRYLTTNEALFALKRWRTLIGQYWFLPVRLKAKVVTRKTSKFLYYENNVGQAPPA